MYCNSHRHVRNSVAVSVWERSVRVISGSIALEFWKRKFVGVALKQQQHIFCIDRELNLVELKNPSLKWIDPLQRLTIFTTRVNLVLSNQTIVITSCVTTTYVIVKTSCNNQPFI